MARHNQLGAWGEKVAREYLLRQGYAIGGENTLIGKCEVDFIAFKDNWIVFVEVKTRSADEEGALDAVDTKKVRMLARALDTYVSVNRIVHDPRIDVITVVGDPSGDPADAKVEHYPDAFMPPLTAGGR